MNNQYEGLEAALSTQIKVMLTERGWDQKDLAAAVGIERATLNRYLVGHRSMPMPTFFAVAKAFGISPVTLMERAQARLKQ